MNKQLYDCLKEVSALWSQETGKPTSFCTVFELLLWAEKKCEAEMPDTDPAVPLNFGPSAKRREDLVRQIDLFNTVEECAKLRKDRTLMLGMEIADQLKVGQKLNDREKEIKTDLERDRNEGTLFQK